MHPSPMDPALGGPASSPRAYRPVTMHPFQWTLRSADRPALRITLPAMLLASSLQVLQAARSAPSIPRAPLQLHVHARTFLEPY